MTSRPASALRLAVLAVTVPLFAACSDMLTNETVGTAPAPTDPSGGPLFRTYMALGTSLGAGIESGGINDSTQRDAYTFRLAEAMGLLPGTNWEYPSFRYPGCPAPYANILTGQRVGNPTTACYLRDPASASPFIHNLSIPSARAEHILDITALTYPATDSLKLAQFITGGRNPIDVVESVVPTFVTLEVGANDVLGAATRGDATLLTTVAAFQTAFEAIADRLDAIGAEVAMSNIPNVTVIPHFTRAAVLWCLNTGLCPGVPATLPFSSPFFVIDVSCAPGAAGGVGDSYLLTFPATGAITNTLAAGRAATLNCATDVATVQPPAPAPAVPEFPAGATINVAEYGTITQRVTDLNTYLAAEAAARNYAYVDINGALAAQAALIPPIPQFTTPAALFGPLFSLDGIHPNRAGYAIMANTFRVAINTRFATTLPVIN